MKIISNRDILCKLERVTHPPCNWRVSKCLLSSDIVAWVKVKYVPTYTGHSMQVRVCVSVKLGFSRQPGCSGSE